MGGNAFKNLKRISKDEYHDLFIEVKDKLEKSIFIKEPSIHLTRSVKSKESFGDMDLIVDSSNLKYYYINELADEFNLSNDDIIKNGNVVSFKYKNFQIDLILTPYNNLQTSIDYFSWNDLSNLMGRVTHKHGIKFGHDGTWLTLRDDTFHIGDILITKKTSDLCNYMGWNFDEWVNGFNTIEDAFNWLVKTPYFNKEIFSFENRNSESARRDKKRPNYRYFIEWAETQQNLPCYKYESMSGKYGYVSQEPFYSMICEKFPHVKLQYEMYMLDYNKKLKFKEKFNGDIVSGITGLQYKELGGFMKYCKSQFELNPHLVDWIISNSFKERHRELFIKSLKWHMDNNQQYGDSKLHITNPEFFKIDE